MGYAFFMGVHIMKKAIDQYKLPKTITDIFIYIMLTVFILYCGTSGYSGMFESKFNIFCFTCGGYVIITLLILFELILIGHIKFEPTKLIKNMGVPQKLAIVYLIFTWLSALISPYFPDTLIGVSRYEGAITISIYCLVFVLVSYFGKITKHMIYVFSGTVAIFSVICILQIYGLNPFMFYPEGYNYNDAYIAYNGQFLGTIGNTDTVAAFLCIAIPILWMSLIHLTDKKRFFIILPLILSIYVLVKMWVLAGIVGIAIGTLLSIPFSIKMTKAQRKIILLTTSIIFIVGIVSIYFSKTESGLFFEIRALLHGNFDDAFGSGRMYIWKSVLKEIPKNLLLGTGPDTMLNTNIQPFIRFDTRLDASIVGQIDIAHNEYINILFHQGIFAFLSYCALIVSVGYGWLKHGNRFKYIGILGSSFMCYLIQAFFGFSSCVVSPLFWMIMALIISKRNTKENTYE